MRIDLNETIYGGDYLPGEDTDINDVVDVLPDDVEVEVYDGYGVLAHCHFPEQVEQFVNAIEAAEDDALIEVRLAVVAKMSGAPCVALDVLWTPGSTPWEPDEPAQAADIAQAIGNLLRLAEYGVGTTGSAERTPDGAWAIYGDPAESPYTDNFRSVLETLAEQGVVIENSRAVGDTAHVNFPYSTDIDLVFTAIADADFEQCVTFLALKEDDERYWGLTWSWEKPYEGGSAEEAEQDAPEHQTAKVGDLDINVEIADLVRWCAENDLATTCSCQGDEDSWPYIKFEHLFHAQQFIRHLVQEYPNADAWAEHMPVCDDEWDDNAPREEWRVGFDRDGHLCSCCA